MLRLFFGGVMEHAKHLPRTLASVLNRNWFTYHIKMDRLTHKQLLKEFVDRADLSHLRYYYPMIATDKSITAFIGHNAYLLCDYNNYYNIGKYMNIHNHNDDEVDIW